jgi:hypothetical protein
VKLRSPWGCAAFHRPAAPHRGGARNKVASSPREDATKLRRENDILRMIVLSIDGGYYVRHLPLISLDYSAFTRFYPRSYHVSSSRLCSIMTGSAVVLAFCTAVK